MSESESRTEALIKKIFFIYINYQYFLLQGKQILTNQIVFDGIRAEIEGDA